MPRCRATRPSAPEGVAARLATPDIRHSLLASVRATEEKQMGSFGAAEVCFCAFGLTFDLRRQAWDLAVDICLSQLPTIIEEGTAFRVSQLCSLASLHVCCSSGARPALCSVLHLE